MPWATPIPRFHRASDWATQNAPDIARELYLSMLVDRSSKTLTFIASSDGGVEIEKVAKDNPDLIIKD